MKKVFVSMVLGSTLAITACTSSTTTSTSGVDRKQLLMVSEQQINQLSYQSYAQTISQAKTKGVLNTNTAQHQRLQRIANKLIPQAKYLRPQASSWQWEVNLLKSDELNAFCMPGGKIMFYTGIIDRLKLTDDEIAAIMGHEMAHALREHGRENVSRQQAQQTGLSLLASVVGLSEGQAQLASLVSQVGLTLPNSRTQESEADLLGLELMARAGYNPNASVTLWQKMMSANNSNSPQFLSTHPSPTNRIQTLQSLIPKMMPLYLAAKR